MKTVGPSNSEALGNILDTGRRRPCTECDPDGYNGWGKKGMKETWEDFMDGRVKPAPRDRTCNGRREYMCF